MRNSYLPLVSALSGVATVWIPFWLVDTVAPPVGFVISFELGRVAIVILILIASAAVVHAGHVPEAAGLLFGAAAAWALYEVRPLSICQSDLPYRSCTTGETALMVLPALGLLFAGAGCAASGLVRRRKVSR